MKRAGPWLLGLAFFLGYAATGATTVQGGDSGQFTLLSALGGIAHPPGYPLHTLLLMAFGELPINPVLASALPSALLGALTVSVLAIALRTSHGNGPAHAAAAALGCAPAFWHYSVVAEVFSGAALSFALVLLVATRISEGARGWRWQLALGLAVASGVAHHHIIVFIAPLAIWAFWRAGPRHVLACVAGLLPGFIAYLTLMRSGGGWRWGDPSDLAGVVDHFLRRDFGTFKLTIDDADVSWWEHPALYLSELPDEFFGVFLLAAGAGLWLTLGPGGKQRGFHWAVVASWALSSLGFLALFNVPADGLGAVMAKRFHVPSLVLVTPFIAASARRLPASKLARGAVVAILVAFALSSGNRNDQRHWTVLEDYALNSLRSVEPNALILGQGDSIFYAMIYAQDVLGEREDVVFVHPKMTSWGWYRERVERQNPGFEFVDARSIPQLVAQSYGERPIYVAHGWMSMPSVANKLPPAYPAGAVHMRLLGPGEALPTPAEVEAEMDAAVASFQFRSRARTEHQRARTYESQAIAQYAWSWSTLAKAYRADGDEEGATRCEAKAALFSGGEVSSGGVSGGE